MDKDNRYKKQKGCEGCRVYPCFLYNLSSSIPDALPKYDLSFIKTCPCTDCIVKSMCNVVCQQLAEYNPGY